MRRLQLVGGPRPWIEIRNPPQRLSPPVDDEAMLLPPQAEQAEVPAEVADEVAARDALVWRIHTSLPTGYNRADFVSAINVAVMKSPRLYKRSGQTDQMFVSQLLNSHKKTVEPLNSNVSWNLHLSHAKLYRRRVRGPKGRKVDFDLVSIPETAPGVYED